MASMVIIHPDGSFETPDTEPTLDALRAAVGVEGEDYTIAEMIRSDIGGILLWGNEDFVAHAQAGRAERNRVGTALALDIGADRQPYAGNLVITGARYDVEEGYSPGPLDAEQAEDLVTMLRTIRDIAGIEAYDWRGLATFPSDALDAIERTMRARLAVADDPWPTLQFREFGSIDEVIKHITGEHA